MKLIVFKFPIYIVTATVMFFLSNRLYASENDNQIQNAIHLLDYLSKDYPMAIQNGKIINETEYKEMMEFTKNNILSQAAQAMLAQANQQPQGVLQLLQ